MLTLLATTLANYAPSVQQQTRLSMSRVTGVSQPIQDVVQQLRGGGESCDVILVSKHMCTKLIPCTAPHDLGRSLQVGCGVPKRGMGWYHGKQMLEGMCPSAKLTTIVEPYFLGDGADSPPGKAFKAWADDMSATHGTKFCKSVGDVEINVRLAARPRQQRRLQPSSPAASPPAGRAPPSP